MTHGLATMERPCANCGDTGVGLLGVHEVVVGYEYLEHPDTPEQPYPVPIIQEQEEFGTPCPTCGKEADDNKKKEVTENDKTT